MIEGFKDIAAHVSTATGRTFTIDAARAAYRRLRDPMPCEAFNGRVAIARQILDAWIGRQQGRRLRKSTAQAA